MVRIGCHELECLGDKPPQDHPHVYFNMGEASEIVCPYCALRYSVSMSVNGMIYLPTFSAGSSSTRRRENHMMLPD